MTAPTTEREAVAVVLPRLAQFKDSYQPKSLMGRTIAEAMPYLPPDLAAELQERARAATVIESSLALRVLRAKDSRFRAGHDDIEDYGIVSRHVVTDAGVDYIVDAFQNTTELEIFRFHGIGTGSTAENQTDTALVTELTTEYNPDGDRVSGSQGENGTNVYQTVGTNTLDSGSPGLREHGIFDLITAGTLLDRSVFALITLDGSAGDGLQSTYDFTVTAGS